MNRSELNLNLQSIKNESQQFINTAANLQRIQPQIEGFIFLAQLYALERQHCATAQRSEHFLEQGRTAIKAARYLYANHGNQAQGLSSEIDTAEKMLNGSTFYTAVTSEERMTVIAAMAREFRGTGHWYYCQNRHPFTIGGCGMAMQLATCPECGAQVGGDNHQTVAGVRHASD